MGSSYSSSVSGKGTALPLAKYKTRLWLPYGSAYNKWAGHATRQTLCMGAVVRRKHMARCGAHAVYPAVWGAISPLSLMGWEAGKRSRGRLLAYSKQAMQRLERRGSE